MKDELERTSAYHMEYYGLIDRQVCDVAGRDPSPTEIRTRAINHLTQQIEQDPEYPSYPPHTKEDYMEYRLYDLEDKELLPLRLSAHEIYFSWLARRRPDTKVIHLGEQVRKPFYE